MCGQSVLQSRTPTLLSRYIIATLGLMLAASFRPAHAKYYRWGGSEIGAAAGVRAGALPMSGGPQRIALSMSVGSLVGAAVGRLAVAVAPAALLKALLGCMLIVAAVKTMAD